MENIDVVKRRIINRQVNPLLNDLPNWVEGFRSHQVTAISQVVEAFGRVPVVILDAPTGSGKTLIGESVRRLLESSAVYMCTTKGLQDQVAKDFPYGRVLKGRDNYATRKFPSKFHPDEFYGHISCGDCTWNKLRPTCQFCDSKHQCPYELAKKEALSARLAILNTSYFLTECNGPGRFSNQDLVIADEADTLESQLMGYVSVEISKSRMEKFNWDPPEKVTVQSSWEKWLDEKIPEVRDCHASLNPDSTDLRGNREVRYLARLSESLDIVRQGLDTGVWVYTGRNGYVSFRPSRVDILGNQYLWRHSKQFLLMSATVISAEELLSSLGYNGKYEVVRCNSTFDSRRRPVHVVNSANMSRKTAEKETGGLLDAITTILARHENDRVLVHTVSYDLAKTVYDHVRRMGRPVFSYGQSSQRSASLDGYLDEPGAVLIAPSMDRGVDLPHELCRVQIIAKIPYPNLGDKQISTRLYGTGKSGQVWYSVQTVRTLVQMCGRAVRSESDWAQTYILDSQMQSLWGRNRGLFPQWFVDAIRWERRGITDIAVLSPRDTQV